jgi:hypothetical protein
MRHADFIVQMMIREGEAMIQSPPSQRRKSTIRPPRLTTLTVAHLRPHILHRGALLLRLRNSHKLALHRLPIRLRRRLPPDHLPAALRPQA